MIRLHSLRSTIDLTATQSGFDSGATVGDSIPGVIEQAASSAERGMSYSIIA